MNTTGRVWNGEPDAQSNNNQRCGVPIQTYSLVRAAICIHVKIWRKKKELYVYACCAMPDDEYWLANWLFELTRWINGWMTGYMAWSLWKLDLKAFRF